MTSVEKKHKGSPLAERTPVKQRTRKAHPFPTQSLVLIVRPVYDQNATIVGDRLNPFGYPANLEEQREAWRTPVPRYKNPRVLNDEIFTVKRISDHARTKAMGAPLHTNRLEILESARCFSLKAAQCLTLIMIVEHGDGSAKQGELEYNRALSTGVFVEEFTRYYRNFVDGLRLRINDKRDQWTMEAMKEWVTTRGPIPVGCKVVPGKTASSKPRKTA